MFIIIPKSENFANLESLRAHGERLDTLSLDENRYNEIHNIVFGLIEQFAIDISNSASLKNYLK